jgi:hypothetical protein
MSAPIYWNEFVITSRKEDGGFHCKIVHEHGQPFVVGHTVKTEFRTGQFATELEAILNAKRIARRATTQKKFSPRPTITFGQRATTRATPRG